MGNEHSNLTEKSILSPQTMDEEIHHDPNCKCKRRRLQHKGKYYYVYYRKCVCKQFHDRSDCFQKNLQDSDLPNGNINKDGVDIHENADCNYTYAKRQGDKTQFRLHCTCKTVSSRNMTR